MNNIFDALEISLQELEDGTELEVVLGHFPDFADELRPILETSIKARGMSVAGPSPDAVRRGRAKVLQRTAELRKVKAGPQKRVIPIFQRLAISFSLVALFLTSGTGLVNASSTALPGESLYPVKRTWEDIRLLFIFDEHERNLLRYEFEDERLDEVNELMSEGRHETIQIAGVFTETNGKTYVSGIRVIIPSNIVLPGNGTSVILTGITNSDGFVEVFTIAPLPDGSVVPLGRPIEVEVESENESEGLSPPPLPTIAPQETEIKYFGMEGVLQAINSTSLVVNDVTVLLDRPKIEGELCVGIRVELKGYFAPDGSFMVTQVDAEEPCVSSGPMPDPATNTNSNTGSDDTNNTGESNDSGGNIGSGLNGNANDSNSNNEGNDNTNDNGSDDNANDSGSDDNVNGSGSDDD